MAGLVIMKLSFDVGSDLYLAGRTEDGQDFTAELYYVMAEDASGNRWRHETNFPGADAQRDEDGYWHFGDVREAAQRAAEQLLARIERAGGQLDLTHWREARPAYGSAAYVQYGQFDDWCDEQRERI
jgi:hypothetical protein